MVARTGVATRPAGADAAGPAAGTKVAWRLARPVENLVDQALALKWTVLGTIGNTDHLRKHGDHTPWSAGKQRGIVYAIDVAEPDGFAAWFRRMCKSDYNTLWVDFWNCDGSQYDNAGERVAASGDHHLHISVAKGHENTVVTLFSDYAKTVTPVKETPVTTPATPAPDKVYTLLHDGLRDGPHQTANGGVAIAWIVRRLAEIEAKQDKVIRLLEAQAPPAA